MSTKPAAPVPAVSEGTKAAAAQEAAAKAQGTQTAPSPAETRLQKLEDEFEKLKAKLVAHGIHF